MSKTERGLGLWLGLVDTRFHTTIIFNPFHLSSVVVRLSDLIKRTHFAQSCGLHALRALESGPLRMPQVEQLSTWAFLS